MIVVAGSTGLLGFEICRSLRARGKDVRALVRATSAAEQVDALRKIGCEVAVCDLKDRASLDGPCKGADTVVSTVTVITKAKEGDSFASTDGAGNINLIDAAVGAKAKRFVFVSFDTDGMPDAPLVAAKRAVEAHLMKSGLDYTILHPSLFMEIWLSPMLFADPEKGTATLYGGRDVKFRYVAVRDVAEVAARSLDHPSAHNKVIPFGGPEALSQREALKKFENAFAKPFAVTEVPEDVLETQWTQAPDPFSKSFAALMLGVSRGGAAGAELSADFDMKLRTVDEYASDMRNI